MPLINRLILKVGCRSVNLQDCKLHHYLAQVAEVLLSGARLLNVDGKILDLFLSFLVRVCGKFIEIIIASKAPGDFLLHFGLITFRSV